MNWMERKGRGTTTRRTIHDEVTPHGIKRKGKGKRYEEGDDNRGEEKEEEEVEEEEGGGGEKRHRGEEEAAKAEKENQMKKIHNNPQKN